MAGGINPIGNLPGAVDANNALLVALAEGSNVPAGTGTAQAGLGGPLTVSTTSAQTGANTNETDLWTYSLPANTLSANNYGVRIVAYGSAAANSNGKTMRLKFGAATISPGSLTINNLGWAFDVTVTRTTAGAQLLVGTSFDASGYPRTFVPTTASADETTTVALSITGQNGTSSAGDIVLRYVRVDFLRAGS